MPQHIEFHVDFTSPYGDRSLEKIEPLADRKAFKVKWQPFFLIGGEPFSGADHRPRTGHWPTGGGF